MQLLWFLASTHLRARWRQTLMLMASVAVGVAILTTALSLTNGFEADLIGRILGTTPHVSVSNAVTGRVDNYQALQTDLAAMKEVKTALPFVSGQGLLVRNGQTSGILIRGIDPKQEAKNEDWTRFVLVGDLDRVEGGATPVMLGGELAKKLGAGMGDRLKLVTGMNRSQDVVVTGIYQAGLYEYDAHIAFVPLDTAQNLFNMNGAVSGIALRLHEVFKAPAIARDIQDRHPYHVRSWTVQNQSLMAALALEKRVIFLVILFIIVVATMGIANTLAMWVLERNRELSLVRAVGATGTQIGALVVTEGMVVALGGVTLGLAAGVGLSLGLATFPISLPSDVYFIDKLPVDMQVGDFVATAIAAIIISLMACLLPARRAIRLDPIEVIRRT
ncbi:Lipoprotein-releasing system transmembrane protein LolE [compost metagenome]